VRPGLAEELGLGAIAPPALAKLYLRASGQRQPHAAYTFSIAQSPDSDALPPTVPDQSTVPDHSELPSEATADAVEDPSTAASGQDVNATPADAESSALAPPSLVETPLSSARPARSSRLPWLVAGIGVSIAGFTTGLWLMSRPCAMGACEPLQTAQALNQQATQVLQTAKTEQDLQQAQQQLTEANRRLGEIPIWSSHHGEAQTLQQVTQSQLDLLKQVFVATGKAATAMQKSQALPQTAADLQTTQSLWREAIAQLQTVPATSPLHTFVQEHMREFATNLEATGKLSTAEQQAQKTIALAKDTARIATARQGIAQSVENWQLAQSTWQVAVNTLKQIPSSTTSYAEAQQLLSDYQPKLMAVRDRAMQEQIARNAFNQAMVLAQKAETAQRQNQWNQAVATWREALANIKQVPQNTAYAEPAQPLVASYSTSLKQAEAQLQVALALQRTRDDLNRVCAGSPKLCTYAIASDVIRVQFTADYERRLRTAFMVGRAGDNGTLGGAVNHIETLQTALQTISNNAGLPLEVYSADGSELIGSFNPKG